MYLQTPNTIDAVQEKHVPVIERNDTGYLVKIGSEPHPMEESHHIQWIELMVDDKAVNRVYLAINEAPQAQFFGHYPEHQHVWAREFCNLHGLWEIR